jgi:hypothetical protein
VNPIVSLALAAVFGAAPVPAQPLMNIAPAPLLIQGAECYAKGEAEAAARGGTLASADEAQQNGAPVCQIIILVPGKDGARPKRMEIIVPKG